MPKTALVPIAHGTEEIEAVCIIDTLRRAEVNVTVASVAETLQVTCSRGIKIVADAMIGDIISQEFDLIAVPGGIPGAEHIRDSTPFVSMLKRHVEKGKLHGAICAAPEVVFHTHGIITDQPATAFPAYAAHLPNQSAVNERVVIFDKLITSRGPGSAIEFTLALIAALFDAETADAIGARMQLPTL